MSFSYSGAFGHGEQIHCFGLLLLLVLRSREAGNVYFEDCVDILVQMEKGLSHVVGDRNLVGGGKWWKWGSRELLKNEVVEKIEHLVKRLNLTTGRRRTDSRNLHQRENPVSWEKVWEARGKEPKRKDEAIVRIRESREDVERHEREGN